MSDKHSLDFTLTRILMKILRTGSSVVTEECQLQFNVLPLRYQIDIRTIKFLQQFMLSTNSLCSMFAEQAMHNLHEIFSKYGENVTNITDVKGLIYEQFAASIN